MELINRANILRYIADLQYSLTPGTDESPIEPDASAYRVLNYVWNTVAAAVDYSGEYIPVVGCRDCKHWNPGGITEKDDFIPPKCQLQKSSWDAYHADHYCGWAERRTE